MKPENVNRMDPSTNLYKLKLSDNFDILGTVLFQKIRKHCIEVKKTQCPFISARCGPPAF